MIQLVLRHQHLASMHQQPFTRLSPGSGWRWRCGNTVDGFRNPAFTNWYGKILMYTQTHLPVGVPSLNPKGMANWHPVTESRTIWHPKLEDPGINIPLFTWFYDHPNAGWPWDFWLPSTSNWEWFGAIRTWFGIDLYRLSQDGPYLYPFIRPFTRGYKPIYNW